MSRVDHGHHALIGCFCARVNRGQFAGNPLTCVLWNLRRSQTDCFIELMTQAEQSLVTIKDIVDNFLSSKQGTDVSRVFHGR